MYRNPNRLITVDTSENSYYKDRVTGYKTELQQNFAARLLSAVGKSSIPGEEEVGIVINGQVLRLAPEFSHNFLNKYLNNRGVFRNVYAYYDCAWFASGIIDIHPKIIPFDGSSSILNFIRMPEVWNKSKDDVDDYVLQNQLNSLNWRPNFLYMYQGRQFTHAGTVLTAGEANDDVYVLSKVGRGGDVTVSTVDQLTEFYGTDTYALYYQP